MGARMALTGAQLMAALSVLVRPKCGQGSWAATPAPSPLDSHSVFDVGLFETSDPSVSVQGGCRGGNLALALAPSPRIGAL
jgi:hypothetical protein